MKSNVLWVGIACLALGVLIGRELPWSRGGPGQAVLPPVSEGANAIPAAWIKEGELGATEAFAGLTPAQRYTVLKVMNEKPCDCGCQVQERGSGVPAGTGDSPDRRGHGQAGQEL